MSKTSALWFALIIAVAVMIGLLIERYTLQPIEETTDDECIVCCTRRIIRRDTHEYCSFRNTRMCNDWRNETNCPSYINN